MDQTDEMEQILTIAVVGLGYRAPAHLSTIKKMTDAYRLVGVCDIVPERAEEVGARYSVPAYTDPEKMLQSERPDVVFIVAPPEVHHTISNLSASYGAHILCETPITTTLSLADQMIDVAAKHNVKLEITENVWRRPEERFKKMLIEGGLIGDVHTARLWYRSGSYHGINALRMLVGSEVVKVVGMAKVFETEKNTRWVHSGIFRLFGPAEVRPPARGEETTFASWEAALLHFQNGVVATYEFPVSPRPKGNEWHIHGSKGYIAQNNVVIDEGSCAYKIVLETEQVGEEQVPSQVRLHDKEGPVDGYVWRNPFIRYKPSNSDEVARMDQLMTMHRAIVDDQEPEYSALNARRDIEVLIALLESARLGSQPLELPLQHMTGYEKVIDAV